MAEYYISGGLLVAAENILTNHSLIVSGSKIKSIVPADAAPSEGQEVMDASGLYIVPGFIDLHVHGGGGADILDGTPASLEKMACFHGRHGTTGMLPAIAAAPLAQMIKTLENLCNWDNTGEGAHILGVHLEGPYLNPQYAGAIDPAHLRRPDPEEMELFIGIAGGLLRIVTLAPEIPGNTEIIKDLADRGIIVAAGHTGASFEQINRASGYGLRHATHIFNAMGPFHHRKPGAAGAVLANPGLSAEIIADGIHIHPAFLNLAWRLKGDNLALVTDALAAAGMPDGTYQFTGRKVTLTSGQILMESGRLAGSVLTMDRAVRQMVNLAGLSLPAAVRLASAAPARILGLGHRKGILAEGYDADLVLLDRDFNAVLTMVEGKIIYQDKTAGIKIKDA